MSWNLLYNKLMIISAGTAYTENTTHAGHHSAGLTLLEALWPGKLPEILTAESGRPYQSLYPELDFNISHSGNLAACIVAEGRVGCDIQTVKRKFYPETAKRFFHPREYSFIEQAPDEEEKKRRFYTLWVLKEAHIKLLGTSVTEIRKTPVFLFEEGRLNCTGEHFFYEVYRSRDYMLAFAFEKEHSLRNGEIKHFGENREDFTYFLSNMQSVKS